MSFHPYFEVYSPARTRPLDDLFSARPLTCLLLAGIVNPFGPTLQALLARGDHTIDGHSFGLSYLLLNPFQQTLEDVGEGYFCEPGYYDEAECFAPYFTRFGTCPTLLFDVPAFIPEAEWRHPYLRDFLNGRPSMPRVLQSVKQHLYDPWTRVQQDLKRLRPGTPHPLPKDSPAPDGHAQELLNLLLDERHTVSELQAFTAAWTGAIAFQKQSGNHARAASAMPFDRFLQFFTHLERAALKPIT